MIVLTKKRILYAIGIISMCIFAYTITGLNIISTNKNQLETVQTVALPTNNKVIVIDAGHGVPDEGAQSSNRCNRG